MRYIFIFIHFIAFSVEAQVDFLPVLYSPYNGDTLHGHKPFFEWINSPNVYSSSYLEVVRVKSGQQLIEALEINPKLIDVQLLGSQTFFNSNSAQYLSDTGKYCWRVCYQINSGLDNNLLPRVCSSPFWFYSIASSKNPYCELVLNSIVPKGFQVAYSPLVRVKLLTFSSESVPILEISEEKSEITSRFEGVYDPVSQQFTFDLSGYGFKRTKTIPIIYNGRIVDPSDQASEGYFRLIYQ